MSQRRLDPERLAVPGVLVRSEQAAAQLHASQRLGAAASSNTGWTQAAVGLIVIATVGSSTTSRIARRSGTYDSASSRAPWTSTAGGLAKLRAHSNSRASSASLVPMSQTQVCTSIGLERPRVSSDSSWAVRKGLGRLRDQLMTLLWHGVNWMRSSIAQPVVLPRASGQWLPQ